jgi:hypothetical protein
MPHRLIRPSLVLGVMAACAVLSGAGCSSGGALHPADAGAPSDGGTSREGGSTADTGVDGDARPPPGSDAGSAGQPWHGILSPSRATDWTLAGLPGDLPPDSSWTQSGSTITPSGDTSGTTDQKKINDAISSCGTYHYVLLGSGDFYSVGSIFMKSNCVLRGAGAAATRLHAVSGGSYGCNGQWGLVCIVGSNSYFNGNCGVWPSPSSCGLGGIQATNTANWTGGYKEGTSTITLDNVTGITVNQTPIVLDQCDLGFSGNTDNFACGAPATGNAGAVTKATVATGGSGYAVGDTGTIDPIGPDFGMSFGSGTATYQVTSVSSGAVTGFTIANGGFGYTYTQVGTPGTTTKTTGSGSGLTVNVTGFGAYDNGSIMNCAVAMACTSQSPSNTSAPARSQEEVFVATKITGSGPYTVTLDRAIAHPNWASAQGTKAWWGSTTITNVGVEDLELDQSPYSGNCGHGGCMNAVGVNTAYKWWVVGVSSNVANYMHVNAWLTSNGLVRDSYFYETAQKGTQSYGIGCTSQCGGMLYENNIVQGVVDAIVPSGTCTGCVVAHNFAVNADNADTAVLFASNPMHTASTDYILEEGNIGGGVNLDATHGPHFFNTFFRDYFTGYEANEGVLPYQSTIPVIIDAYSRYNNMIGNVLGTAGYHTTYKCVPAAPLQKYCTGYSQYVTNAIWLIGWSHSDQLDYNYDPPTPNDMVSAPSTMLWGNFDTVHNAAQWNASEVPSADPNFPNGVPSTRTLPASFYDGVYSAHPSCGTGLPFWKNPTTGTCPPYPAIGPDVTSGDIGMCTSGPFKWSRALAAAQCSSGTFGASGNGGSGNSNPAMRCYLNELKGPPDGTGPFLAFNRASCYATDP